MQDLYMLMTITRSDDSNEFISFFRKHDTACEYTQYGIGTARPDVLDLLGLERSKKAIHVSVVTHNKLYELLPALVNEMKLDYPDRGIALSVPLAAVISRSTLSYLSGGRQDDEMTVINDGKEKPEMELIIAICNRGYADEVMEAAREGGARGGTIVNAKGTAAENERKFYGMQIAEEKEMLYIVSSGKKRNDIMKAVTEKAGPATRAHAITFSLPVSDVAGFKLIENEQ